MTMKPALSPLTRVALLPLTCVCVANGDPLRGSEIGAKCTLDRELRRLISSILRQLPHFSDALICRQRHLNWPARSPDVSDL